MKLGLFTLFAFASALPTVAATFTITDIMDPNGVTTNAISPFTFLEITNGSAGDGLAWTNVGAEINTGGSVTDLGFFGAFSCATVGGCSDTFEVDYSASGFMSGTTAYVGLIGFSNMGSAALQGFALNQSLGFVSSNGSEFNITSNPVLVGSPAEFSGDMLITITLQNGGTLNLPGGATADLVTTQGSAPEPGTLGIVAASGLLLFYIRRLRKA
jgi:hypothetical protein